MQSLFDQSHVVATWLTSVISSIVATLAVLGVTYKYFGERIIGHFFDKRLEEFKHDRARDLEHFKHQHDQEIEQLKGQISHLSDRSQRSNEREYIAITVIWEKIVDLYYATNMAIISYIQYPPLNKMPNEELVEFLNTTELNDQQKRLVTQADDKERSYSHIMGRMHINAALTQVFAVNETLQKQGIFVPPELYIVFDAFKDLCSRGIVQRKTEYGETFRTGLKHDIEFLQQGTPRLEALKVAVRARLLPK